MTASPAIIKALGFSVVLFGSFLVAYSVPLQPVEQQTTSDKRAGKPVGPSPADEGSA